MAQQPACRTGGGPQWVENELLTKRLPIDDETGALRDAVVEFPRAVVSFVSLPVDALRALRFGFLGGACDKRRRHAAPPCRFRREQVLQIAGRCDGGGAAV